MVVGRGHGGGVRVAREKPCESRLFFAACGVTAGSVAGASAPPSDSSARRLETVMRTLARRTLRTRGSATVLPVLLAAALGTLCIFPSGAFAQATPRELRQSANTKLARGAYLDAISDLEQLIIYLGESKDDRIKASMDPIFYHLAICYFFVGQFGEAQTAFEKYVKKYPYGSRSRKAVVYIADCMRYKGSLEQAIKAYKAALQKYGNEFSKSLKADIWAAISRCHLADGAWEEAIDPLKRTYYYAPDFLRRNWAATLLTTAYFKEVALDKIYPLVPFLLRPNSLASRSIAFNMAALECGDELFAEERYRDALWVHRMVYPHDMVMLRSEEYLEYLQKLADDVKQRPGDPRRLMRIQESIGELEEEIKALQSIDNYDIELYSRVARGYMEMMRYWEAREIFLHLNEIADPELAEESLFLAFRCSTRLLPWDRAFAIGEEYMRIYPGGEFFDIITLAMGQMYAKQQNWPKTIEHLKKALELSPKHESMAECYFLIGYASFMEEIFDEAVDYFSRITRKFPGNELVPPASYWTGMSYLFDANYELAAPEFDRVLLDFPNCMYVEDAAFRRSVCDYGMSRFEDAGTRLAMFMKVYSQSKLLGEATMMSGDIAGALGKLKEAIVFYKKAMAFKDLNIEFYNHSAFQTGRLLGDEEEWGRMCSHYRRYMEENREGSNIPLAVYWVGVGLWNQGEEDDALRFYREAVEKYGKDRTAIGVDMILDEWVGRTKRSTEERQKKAWRDLSESLVRAMRGGHKAMELRLKRVLLYHPHLKLEDKQRVTRELLNPDNIPHASPAVLQSMLDQARESGEPDLAVKVAKHIIETLTETDYALDARMILADMEIERARNSRTTEEASLHYGEAVKHLDVVRAVFATSAEAAQALSLLAKIYSQQEKYKKADECYRSILGVKGWRTYWPEALHGRGECAFEQRQYEAASAYYERIYLMYSHYKEWAGKAYLRRAECLRRLYQSDKAAEVLREFLGDEDLSKLPEAEEARKLMKRMGVES